MSLKQKALGSVKFAGLSAVLTNGLQLVQLVVLARLLAPSDFGLMGMVLLTTNGLMLLGDLGLSSAVIQRREVSDESLSSLYWLNMILGAAYFVGLWAASPLIARLFQEPRLQPILVVAGLNFLIMPLGSLFKARLEKALRFGRLAMIEATGAVTGVAVAIGMALSGAGVWSLVGGLMANSGLQAAWLLAEGLRVWRPARVFKPRALEPYLRFGLPLVGQRLAGFTGNNVDSLAIGTLIGAQALGFYSMAFNLANMPVSKLFPVITRVSFPLLSQAQDDLRRQRLGYRRMQEYTSTVAMPVLFGMAATAPLAVPLFLGPSWISIVPLLQILCFVGLTRSIMSTFGSVLLARGQSALGFRWGLLLVSLQVPAIFLGVWLGGALGAALAFAGLQVLIVALHYTVLVRRVLGPCLGDYLGSVLPALGMSLVMVAAMLGATLPLSGQPGWLLLAMQVGIGVAVYAIELRLFRHAFLIDLASILARRKAG